MIMKRIQEDCRKHNKKMYVFLYSPHPLVFLYNKMFNKYYKNIKMSDVTFKLLPTKETVNIYSKSKCIIDVESSTQTGLTMRTIEVLGLRKKLITTNKDIVNYDFYNENNYFILDRESLFLDYSFIDKEYIPIDKELYEKYSLENWLNIIIGGR